VIDRWRGRRAGLAVVAALVGLLVAAALSGGAEPSTSLVVRDGDGRVLARVTLPDDGAFALRYRNSLYGTVAEERFTVTTGGGTIELRQLAARQLAVLEEYYAVSVRPELGADGWWRAPPADELKLDELTLAATDLGRRTLLVEGEAPLRLWRLVADAAPSVVLEAEPGR
jgi:hypothetical protein